MRFILILTFIVWRWSMVSVVIIIFVFVSFLFSSSCSWFIFIIVSPFSATVVFILLVLLVCQKLNLCNKSIISNGGNNVSRAARKQIRENVLIRQKGCVITVRRKRHYNKIISFLRTYFQWNGMCSFVILNVLWSIMWILGFGC